MILRIASSTWAKYCSRLLDARARRARTCRRICPASTVGKKSLPDHAEQQPQETSDQHDEGDHDDRARCSSAQASSPP